MENQTHQWRKAFRRNMAVNCSATRFQTSWMAVELPTKVVDIFRPLGGTSQIDAFTLFGIHSTKYDEFLLTTFSIWVGQRARWGTTTAVNGNGHENEQRII